MAEPEQADRAALLAEAYKRNLLPPDQKAAYEEAQKRGLVGGDQPGTFVAAGDQPAAPPYQMWPERMFRSLVVEPLEAGAEVTKKAMTGELGQPGTREFTEAAIPGAAKAAQLGVVGAPSAEAAAARSIATVAQRGAVRAAQLPSDAIKAGAQWAYEAVANARLFTTPSSVDNLVAGARAALDQKLMTQGTAQRTFRGLEQLEQSKAKGDIAQILSLRQRLGEIGPEESTDFAAAQEVRAAIDNYIETLKPSDIVSGDAKFTQQMLEKARGDWRAYAKLDQIETALKVGKHQAAVAGTGANTQNAMMQRIRQILDSEAQSRGYTAAEKQELENIVMGTWASNKARYFGKFAPSGPVSLMSTLAAGFGMGSHAGPEAGALAAAAVAIPTTIAKYLGTYLTKRQIRALEDVIRESSPANQASVARARAQPPPAIAGAARRIIPGAGPFAAPALSSVLSGGTPATDALTSTEAPQL